MTTCLCLLFFFFFFFGVCVCLRVCVIGKQIESERKDRDAKRREGERREKEGRLSLFSWYFGKFFDLVSTMPERYGRKGK